MLSKLVASLVNVFITVNSDAFHTATIVPWNLVHFQNQLGPLLVLNDGPEVAWTPKNFRIEVARTEYLIPVGSQFPIRDRGIKCE